MGVTAFSPTSSVSGGGNVRDYDMGTYWEQIKAINFNAQTNSVTYTCLSAYGYPSDRYIYNVRVGLNYYLSKSTAACHLSSDIGSTAYGGGTTVYTTVYGGWAGVPTYGSAFNGYFVVDTRGVSSGNTTVRLLDAFAEVYYADWPSTPASGGNKSVVAASFTMDAYLQAIGTGQNQYAYYQLATDAGFAGIIQSTNSGWQAPSTWATVGSVGVVPGTYYYRAYAVDAYGYSTGWSGTSTVTVTYPGPTVPTMQTGISVDDGGAGTVTFSYGAYLDPISTGQTQKARMQVATDVGFTNIVQNVETGYVTSGWQYQTSPALATGVYYTRAMTTDVYGSTSAYSAATNVYITHHSNQSSWGVLIS
jgi:hypothetical protein